MASITKDILQKLNAAFEKTSFSDENHYQLIVESNALWDDIENEISRIHNFIRDTYRFKFPELEFLVPHPIDYARVVKKIGNETEVASFDLDGLLLPATILAVSVTSTTSAGKQLPEDVLRKTIESCDRVLALDAMKNQLLGLLTTQIAYIAPNLSAIVGVCVAAKLVAAGGGLSRLVNMTSCSVRCLGAREQKNNSRGGYVEETEIFRSTPPYLRLRASRLLANKSIMAARIDFTRMDLTGNKGKILAEEIRKKILNWQERPPARQPNPLPVPVLETKKQRGGQRSRKRKERYGMTEMRKLANRMPFGIVEESSLGDGLGIGFGMMFDKLRLPIGNSKLVVNKFKRKHQSRSGGGVCASLAFTPVQGIELNNPVTLADHIGGDTYFSETGRFSKISRKI